MAKNNWMVLALIFIFATAGLGFGMYILSSDSQQVLPIPVTTTETVQTGTTTYTEYHFASGASSNHQVNQPWNPMFLEFYKKADWYFYYDDYYNNATYNLTIDLFDGAISRPIFPETRITGDINITLNSTQRNDITTYGGPDSYFEYKFSDQNGYIYTICYICWDVPVLENITHTTWLPYLV